MGLDSEEFSGDKSDGTFEKVKKHVKEFVEATPEQHGK